jgi:23S rRNA A1618 N6-methylase RlmF
MSNEEREKSDQIPTSNNDERTQQIVNDQDNIPGQRKEVQGNYGQLASIGQILKDFDFPATKDKIIEYIKSNSNVDSNVLQKLQNIDDKEYQNSAEIASAAGLT